MGEESIANSYLAIDFAKISHRKFTISHQFLLNEIFSFMIF